MADKKLKVAIICHASSKAIREHLELSGNKLKNIIKRILNKPIRPYNDYGTWNVLSAAEFSKFDEIEFHYVIPHPDVKCGKQDFEMDGIYYHVINQVSRSFTGRYLRNRRKISKILKQITPDVVNLIGLESPFYSASVLDIDVQKVPVIATMQTCMSDPNFEDFYPIKHDHYLGMLACEQNILKHVKYVATDVKWFRELVTSVNPNIQFISSFFCNKAEGESNSLKKFDFVYWAADISKAGDDAIDAFIKASKSCPGITLNLIGGYSDETYARLWGKLQAEGLEDKVSFSGYFPTHRDAISQASKSRFALLPAKIDVLPGTIREAVKMQMPVVTYATKGTPALNIDRQSLLISEIGDTDTMAANMVSLISNEDLQKQLVANASIFAQEHWDNVKGCQLQVETFKAVYDNFYNGIKLPDGATKCLY